jgi:CubicO group peptidase (beta-lactamase class C family)
LKSLDEKTPKDHFGAPSYDLEVMIRPTLISALLLICGAAVSRAAVLSPCDAATANSTKVSKGQRSDAPITISWTNLLRPAVLKSGEPLPHWSLCERMAYYHVPGVAVAVIRNGKVVQAAGYGVLAEGSSQKVNADTLFSVGSVSKVATASIILRMVAAGKLNLDSNVDRYLTSWHVPPTKDVPDPDVTLRMLMSHTSGFNVGGFPDFMPDEHVPTLIETLDGKPPAKHHAVRLTSVPGTRYSYSGGGIMVEQQLLEDVTKTNFADIAKTWLLDPLQMNRSTFVSPLPALTINVAKAHDNDGHLVALPSGWQTFPEQAASGLWSNASELGSWVAALIESYRGQSEFLPRDLATQMMTPVSPSPQGLGPELLGSGDGRVFFHSGSNDNYRAWIEGYLQSGDGFVILTNSSNGSLLRLEIRHALSDRIGRGVDPVLRTVTLDAKDPAYADYKGTYRLDNSVPMNIRGRLADDFDTDTFEVDMSGGKASLRVPGEDHAHPLMALSPTQFVDPDSDTVPLMQFEFHRDAHGKVQAVSVTSGNSLAYYRQDISSGR